jgi:hypothetical protein
MDVLRTVEQSSVAELLELLTSDDGVVLALL